MMRRSLQDGVGMAFHDIAPRSLLLASTASKIQWPDIFEYFDKAADLAALLLFAEDGPATRSSFGGWPPRPDETPEQTFARERRANGDLAEAFAGLMLTRSSSAQRLRELSEHMIDSGQTISFGDGQQGRTAHGFARWASRFVEPYATHRMRFSFQPTEHVPDPWSEAQCAQFDAMPVLSWVYRPRVAGYRDADGTALSDARCAEQLRAALEAAIGGPLEGKAPGRIFYDVGCGDASGPQRMTLTTALHAVLPDFDLLDVEKGYDLSRRLGDTGAATAVAGVGLAGIAAWETGETALVIHARRDDSVIVPAVRPSSDAHRQSYRSGPTKRREGQKMMHRNIAVVGDPTTHGGRVATGSPTDTIDGRAIARLGDLVDCSLHGVQPIIEGDDTTLLDDRPMALEGHRAECGCRLLAGHGNGSVGTKGMR